MDKKSKFALRAIDIWHIRSGEPIYNFRKEEYIRGDGITEEQQRVYGYSDEIVARCEREWGVADIADTPIPFEDVIMDYGE